MFNEEYHTASHYRAAGVVSPWLQDIPSYAYNGYATDLTDGPSNQARVTLISWPTTYEDHGIKQIITNRREVIQTLCQYQHPEISVVLPEFFSAHEACEEMLIMGREFTVLTGNHAWMSGGEAIAWTGNGNHLTIDCLLTQYPRMYLSLLIDACTTHIIQQSELSVIGTTTINEIFNISKALPHFAQHLSRIKNMSKGIIEAIEGNEPDETRRLLEHMKLVNPDFYRILLSTWPFPWRKVLWLNQGYDADIERIHSHAIEKIPGALDPTLQTLLSSLTIPVYTTLNQAREEHNEVTELHSRMNDTAVSVALELALNADQQSGRVPIDNSAIHSVPCQKTEQMLSPHRLQHVQHVVKAGIHQDVGLGTGSRRRRGPKEHAVAIETSKRVEKTTISRRRNQDQYAIKREVHQIEALRTRSMKRMHGQEESGEQIIGTEVRASKKAKMEKEAEEH